MIDVEPLIESSFDRMLPIRPVAGDWPAVLARAGVGARPYLRRRRVGLAAVVIAFVATAGALAAVKELPWWQSGSPAIDPQAVASVARDNLPANVRVADARTVSTEGDAALVAVPLDRTGYCVIPTLDGRASFGAQCIYAVTEPESGKSDTVASVIRPAGGDPRGAWLVYGRIVDPRATTITLGPIAVELDNGGFFLAQVAESQWQSLAGTATAGQITDGAGRTLQRGCVSWGDSPASRDASADAFVWSNAAVPCRVQARPATPQVDYRQAQPIFSVTLTHSYSIWKAGETITFDEAPSNTASACTFPTGPGMTVADIVAGRSTTGCASLEIRGSQSLTAEIEAQLAHETGSTVYVWDVIGSFKTQNVTSVQLLTPDGAISAASGGGRFFVQLPETTPGPAAGALPMPAGDYTLVGYDASGAETARLNLNELYANSNPH